MLQALFYACAAGLAETVYSTDAGVSPSAVTASCRYKKTRPAVPIGF